MDCNDPVRQVTVVLCHPINTNYHTWHIFCVLYIPKAGRSACYTGTASYTLGFTLLGTGLILLILVTIGFFQRGLV